jgi:small subunit ribosomal protein S19
MRSKWKGPFLNKHVFKVFLHKIKVKKVINLYSRSSCILPNFVNFNCKVHNGAISKLISITPAMVGCKFGEYRPTRVRNINRFKFKKLKKKQGKK